MKERVHERIEKVFRPEFLNRLDDTIIFRHLNNEDLKDVIDLELGKVRHRLHDRGHGLELTEEAKQFLIRKGSNLDYGARPLRRAIENYIEDPLSEELLKGVFQGKDKIVVEVVKNDEGKVRRLKFVGVESKADEEPAAAVAGGEASGSKEESPSS
jgi:ATP-dependent Clp protease ATP-binding subunit ClpC